MRIRTLFLPFALSCLLLAGCVGGGSNITADPGKGGGTAASPSRAKVLEIAMAMPASQVTQVLGNASSVGRDAQGRETWTYEGKRANYVYSARRDNRQVMLVDGYGAESGLTTYIVITFDQAMRVADFNYQQMSF